LIPQKFVDLPDRLELSILYEIQQWIEDLISDVSRQMICQKTEKYSMRRWRDRSLAGRRRSPAAKIAEPARTVLNGMHTGERTAKRDLNTLARVSVNRWRNG